MFVPDGLYKHECIEWYNVTIAETHGEKLSELYLNTLVKRLRQENDDTKFFLNHKTRYKPIEKGCAIQG